MCSVLGDNTLHWGEIMESSLIWIGRLAGIAGVVLCALSGLVRVTGTYSLGSYELATLMQVGIAGMIFACFCLLAALTSGLKPGR
jgi:hypothetical protein